MLTANALDRARQLLDLTTRECNPNWPVVVDDARATVARFESETVAREAKRLKDSPRYGARDIADDNKALARLKAALAKIA